MFPCTMGFILTFSYVLLHFAHIHLYYHLSLSPACPLSFPVIPLLCVFVSVYILYTRKLAVWSLPLPPLFSLVPLTTPTSLFMAGSLCVPLAVLELAL